MVGQPFRREVALQSKFLFSKLALLEVFDILVGNARTMAHQATMISLWHNKRYLKESGLRMKLPRLIIGVRHYRFRARSELSVAAVQQP